MTKVSLVPLGSVRDRLGWDQNARQVEVEGERVTVADVLASVPLGDGSTLLDFVAHDGHVRPEYMVHLNGG